MYIYLFNKKTIARERCTYAYSHAYKNIQKVEFLLERIGNVIFFEL